MSRVQGIAAMAQNSEIHALKSDDILRLATEIVAAYVSNNPIPVSEVPAMIKSVHSTLGGLGNGLQGETPADAETGDSDQTLRQSRLHRLPGRRQKAENAEALSAVELQS